MERRQNPEGENKNRDELDLSVVLPVYNEEKNVGPLVDEIVSQLENMGLSYEIIAINVPGRDDSYRALKKAADKHEHFYPINAVYLNTQGYQKGYQYMLGFSLAKGKRVVQMDSDYQDDPKDIPEFLKKLDEGYDMVVGWKQDRKDPFFYKLTSKGQNILTRLVSGVDVHDKNCGFKAYERAAMEAVNLYGMNYRDIPMQLQAKGFKVAEVPVANRKRVGGVSNFTFLNRLVGGTLDFMAALFMSMMIDKPFRVWGGLGLIKLIGGLSIFVLITGWLLWSAGSFAFGWWILWWYLLCGVLIVSGMVSLGIGVVTEYVRSLRKATRNEYHVIDDYKERMKE